MGLDDLVEKKGGDPSSSSRGGGRKKSNNRDIVKDIGSEPHRKKFTEEQWEGVKEMIIQEMEYSVGEVLSMPNQDRYEILHDAILMYRNEQYIEESDHSTDNRCVVCGKDSTGTSVEIEGHRVCINHPAITVREEIDEIEDENNE